MAANYDLYLFTHKNSQNDWKWVKNAGSMGKQFGIEQSDNFDVLVYLCFDLLNKARS